MNKKNFLQMMEMASAIAFFVAFKLYDMNTAVTVLIAFSTAFVVLVKFLGEKLTKLQLITWLAITILGGASVYFKDDNIIKWKPTVINSGISLAFLLTHLFGKKCLVQRLLDEKVPAPAFMLRRVNLAAGIFFAFLATLNIVVAQNFSDNVWMNFKFFGVTALNMSFVGSCVYYLRAYLNDVFPANK